VSATRTQLLRKSVSFLPNEMEEQWPEQWEIGMELINSMPETTTIWGWFILGMVCTTYKNGDFGAEISVM